MKALITTGGSVGTVFPQVPLARALRDAGHQVIMAGARTVTDAIAHSGIPPVVVSAQAGQGLSTEQPDDPVEQMHYVGRWYGRQTMDVLEPLRRVAEDWQPDIVLGGGIFYPAALLGHLLGVPTVLQPWGVLDSSAYDAAAEEEMRPLLDELGLDRLPEPGLRLDVRPPALRPDDAPASQPLRWIPGNLHRPLEPWMYTRGSRPRVLLTSGSRVTREGTLHTMGVQALRETADRFTALGVETLIAVPDDVGAALGGTSPETPGGPRAGWIPMDVVAPTCDLIIHHGGVGSNMTALSTGVPQLIVREIPSLGEMAPQVDFGAAVDLPPDRHGTEDVVEAGRAVLADPSYAERAGLLAKEIAALPAPAEVVGVLERLAARGAR